MTVEEADYKDNVEKTLRDYRKKQMFLIPSGNGSNGLD